MARIAVARYLDYVDRESEDFGKSIYALTNMCDGVLAMRAKRAGKQYTVRICTSPTRISEGQPSIESAEVTINTSP